MHDRITIKAVFLLLGTRDLFKFWEISNNISETAGAG